MRKKFLSATHKYHGGVDTDTIVPFMICAAFLIVLLKRPFFHHPNYFRSAPHGTWTFVGKMGRVEQIPGALAMIGIFWMLFNMPEFTILSLAYALMYMAYLFMWFAEVVTPKLPWGIAVIDPGPIGKWPRAIVLGVLAGLAWFFLLVMLGVVETGAMQAVFITGPAWLFVYGFAVPWVEEQMFRGFALPTQVEGMGIVPSILVIASMFAGFHWFAFQYALPMLLGAFGFAVVASVLVLHTRTTIAGIAMHMVYNILILMLVMG
ncbi:hypothetical protein ES703_37820 [subsurface metagenome]